jgi:hypothetical protein
MRPIQSEAVRGIITRAEEHARAMIHAAVGTQHLLLATIEAGASIEGVTSAQVHDAILRMAPICDRGLAATDAAGTECDRPRRVLCHRIVFEGDRN